MTKTEWNKAKHALASRGEYIAQDGLTIRKHQERYGFRYSGHLTNRVDLIDSPNCEQKFTNVEV